MRKTRKTMALFLVMAMMLTLFAGVAQASTPVTISSSVNVVATAVAAQAIAPGRIDIESAARSAVAAPLTDLGVERTLVRVTLPADVTWAAVPTLPPHILFNAAAPTAQLTVDLNAALEDGGRTAVFRVNNTDAPAVGVTGTDVDLIRLTGLNINLPAAFSGDVTATVALTAQDGAGNEVWTQTGSVLIARVLAAGTTSTALATPAVLRGAANQTAGNIRITENVAGSLFDGSPGPPAGFTNIITLTAPTGVRIRSLTATVTPTGGAAVAFPGAIAGTGTGTVTLTLAGAPFPYAPAFTINTTALTLDVDGTVADGPISIQISGAGATAATVQVATVGPLGLLTPSAITPPALPAINVGRLGETVASIRFTENMPDAMLGNRVVTLSLPAGFTWSASAAPPWAVGAPSISADGRTLTYWTVAAPAGAAVGGGREAFDITGLRINTRIDGTAGDIVVTVGGTAGPTGTVVVGTLRRIATATAATVPNVRADDLNQPVGNVVITEAFAGALMGGNVTLTLPAALLGDTFTRAPVVTVSDVEGTEPTITNIIWTPGATVVTFDVNRPAVPATNPATITVSGLAIDFDRALRVLPGTPINLVVAGTAILEAEIAGTPASERGLANTAPANLTLGAVLGANMATVNVANVIARTFTRSVFTIGALSFVRDGVTTAIDAAPTIVDGRTLLPLRFAALAVGVSEDDIIWDAGRRTVTLLRGDRVVQLRIGDKNMTINGVVVPMDVAAAIVGGRTVLPIGAVARALRADIAWDATARTVTVTTQ